jgi:protease-4
MENKPRSGFRWVIILLIVILVIVGICIGCFGILFAIGASDMKTGTSVNSIDSYEREGSKSETIAVINLDGVIMDAAEANYEDNIVDYTVASLEKARDDENVKAVILVLNTPGGSTYDTARIGDKIDEVKAEGKLVVTVMEQIAASGGYWIAAKSDYIVAGSETITGSVGALWDIVLYDRLLEKIGVDQLTIHNIASPNKSIGDGETRNPESEKYKILQELANRSYDEFVGVVLEGRGKTKEELAPYLDGRILDGTQAVEAGMADQLGYFEDGVEYVKNQLNLSDPNVEMYERKTLNPFNSLFAKLNIMVDHTPESSMRMRMMYLPNVFSSGTQSVSEDK